MKGLLEKDEKKHGCDSHEYNNGEQEDLLGLIHKVIKEATAQPHKVIAWLSNKETLETCYMARGFAASKHLTRLHMIEMTVLQRKKLIFAQSFCKAYFIFHKLDICVEI